MELSQLRYFIETAKSQHITKTAEKLHIAQPALTKSIHKLEKELNVPLFYRKGRNIFLTSYGEHFRDSIIPVMEKLEGAVKEMGIMAEAEARSISISVLAASDIVTRAIIEYKKLNPDINFYVTQNTGNESCDIEVTAEIFKENHKSDENTFVIREDIFLALPDTPQYENISSVCLADMKKEGFISLLGSKQLRNICDLICQKAGFLPNIVFESDSPYTVRNMIGANIGVGFWPEFTWEQVSGSHIRLLPVNQPECARNLIIKYKSIKGESSCAKDFYSFLVDFFIEKKNKM